MESLARVLGRLLATAPAVLGRQEPGGVAHGAFDEGVLAELDLLSANAPLLDIFVTETEKRLDSIDRAVSTGDLAEVAGVAHSLRGSTGHLRRPPAERADLRAGNGLPGGRRPRSGGCGRKGALGVRRPAAIPALPAGGAVRIGSDVAPNRRRRRSRVAAAGLMLATVLAGCGGGHGGGGDRSLEDLEGAVARLQPGDRPVRFRLDTAVAPEVTAFTVETLGWAHADIGDSGPLTVHVYSNEDHFVAAYTGEFAISVAEARRELEEGQLAFATPGGHVWIYLPNYDQATEDERRHVLFHEYVHTLQVWLAEVRVQSEEPAERSFVPRWLIEGCAEYLAVRAGARRGFVDEARQREITVFLARRSAGVPLSTFETQGEAGFLGGSGAAYTVGWLACERLATAHGTDSVTRQFWVSLASKRDWRLAFVDAFGLTPSEFYTDFDSFRATL